MVSPYTSTSDSGYLLRRTTHKCLDMRDKTSNLRTGTTSGCYTCFPRPPSEYRGGPARRRR